MIQYEYVFELGHHIFARLYDTTTNSSTLKKYSKDEFVPSLYLPNSSGEYKSFTNQESLKRLDFSKAQDFRTVLNEYKDSTTAIYGNTSFVQNFIRINFPDHIDSDHTFHTWYLDIECRSTMGFPDPKIAREEISLIQIYDTKVKKFIVLGTKQYTTDTPSEYGDIKYIECESETDMLMKFIQLMNKQDPTAIAGFNSYGFDFPYITNRFQVLGLDQTMLSPVKEIKWIDAKTKDGIEYQRPLWEGRYLLDIQDLYIKYKGANLPRLSLEAISQYELGEGKVQHNEYFSFEEFYLNDFNLFVDYGIKDVELLIQLENKLKLIDTAKYIAYSCGVNVSDVSGTYRQWLSMIYNTAIKENIVLPVKSQFTNPDDVYLGGWVFSKPGHHEWVFSFDFASLYPSVIRFMNLGVDTLVKPYELNDDLLYLKEKYLTYFKKEDEEKIKEFNHNMNEFYFLKNLVENKDDIHEILQRNNVCMSPNGYFYKKDKQSFSSMLMEKFFNQRKVHKKELKKYEDMYDQTKDNKYKMLADKEDLMQFVIKILINSFYGSASMETATFSHGKGYASAVTSVSRFTNRWVAYTVSKRVSNMLNLEYTEEELDKIPILVQADTDSNYLSLKDVIVRKFKDKLEASDSDKIQFGLNFLEKYVEKFIQEAIDEVSYTLNGYNKDVMVMEQETSSNKFVSVADKRYYCRKWYKTYDGEWKTGYKMTGISLVSKSTPTWFKEKLKPVLDIILDKTPKDLIDYTDKIRYELNTIEDISQACVIKGISSIDYELLTDNKASRIKPDGSKQPAPLHSRGALVHNKLLAKYNDISITPIQSGDKAFYCYLKTPNNVFNHNVISFINPTVISKYDIDKYVDWNTMYDKNFLQNIKNITDKIGWSLDKFQNSADEWC